MSMRVETWTIDKSLPSVLDWRRGGGTNGRGGEVVLDLPLLALGGSVGLGVWVCEVMQGKEGDGVRRLRRGVVSLPPPFRKHLLSPACAGTRSVIPERCRSNAAAGVGGNHRECSWLGARMAPCLHADTWTSASRTSYVLRAYMPMLCVLAGQYAPCVSRPVP